jgi:hypothetical protein
MFCTNCGREIDEKAAVCLGCGCEVKNVKNSAKDTGSIGWGFLGFFVPLAGFILWAVLNDTQPKNAKKAGIGAIIGIIASVVGIILLYVFYFALIFIMTGLSF